MQFCTFLIICSLKYISTIKIVRLSVTVGDRRKRHAARGWRTSDTDGLAGWAVTVGVVEVGVAEQYRRSWVSERPGLRGVLAYIV